VPENRPRFQLPPPHPYQNIACSIEGRNMSALCKSSFRGLETTKE
jgi:hypothetical protein